MKKDKDKKNNSANENLKGKKKRKVDSSISENYLSPNPSIGSSNTISLSSVYSRVFEDITNVPYVQDALMSATYSESNVISSITEAMLFESAPKRSRTFKARTNEELMESYSHQPITLTTENQVFSDITNLPKFAADVNFTSDFGTNMTSTRSEDPFMNTAPKRSQNVQDTSRSYIDDKEQIYDCNSQSDADSGSICGDNNTIQQVDEMVSGSVLPMVQRGKKVFGVERRKTMKQKTSKTKDYTRYEYFDEGDPMYTCRYCGAIFWYGERLNRRRRSKKPIFTLCCMQGQVVLPLLKDPPDVLKELFDGNDKLSNNFKENLRPINMVFSFTSLGGKVDRLIKKGRGPNMFQMQGENYHLMGSLKPTAGDFAKYEHLYIVDTENEITNRSTLLRSVFEVGLFLPRPVTSHGQLYVAVSRVTSKKGLKILIVDQEKSQKQTVNVVFKSTFQNL